MAFLVSADFNDLVESHMKLKESKNKFNSVRIGKRYKRHSKGSAKVKSLHKKRKSRQCRVANNAVITNSVSDIYDELQCDLESILSVVDQTDDCHSRTAARAAASKLSKRLKPVKNSCSPVPPDGNLNETVRVKSKASKVTATFVNVGDILAKDARSLGSQGSQGSQKSRIGKEEKQANELYDLYENVYVCMRNSRNEPSKQSEDSEQVIRQILRKMLKYAPSKQEVQNIEKKDLQNFDVCQVCYMNFDESDEKSGSRMIEMKGECAHAMICESCFKQYLSVKIRNDDCMPWLQCPAEDCTSKIHINLIVKYSPLEDVYHFASVLILKHLRRNGCWIDCHTKGCDFGWIWSQSVRANLRNVTHEQDTKRLECKACGQSHEVAKPNLGARSVDPGLEILFKNGTMRKCPQCEWPTMKDKGMCNIMHCARCDIYWNWRTFVTANNSKDLKARARVNGSLWEPGELQYQQQLQRNNLPEFIKLLQRNGIKYDPNYVRGQ